MVSLGRPKNHAKSETVQRFSPTPFARDSLVLRILHDLPRNKQALSSLKYHIFTKILFTDLLQSRPPLGSNAWYSISLLLHHVVSGFVWEFQLAAVYSFHSLGLILSQKKRTQNVDLEYDITFTKWVATLIKHTDHSYFVLLFTSEICN